MHCHKMKKLFCPSSDPALAGSSDVAPAASGARDEVVRQYCCPACLQVGTQMRSDEDLRCVNPHCDVRTFRKSERLAAKK